MKNIILQHWSGPMNELTTLSSANITKYAEKIGADYKLLRGNVFHPKLSSACQKIYMLDEVFDEYDIVVMIDSDVFTRKGMDENIFTDVEGVGRHTKVQEQLKKGLQRKYPDLANPNYPYWGGSIYKLSLDLRKRLRKHIKEREIIRFSGNQRTFQDEGIMHRLATLADINGNTYFPDDRWNRSSYEPNVGTAATIHIRTKTTPKGPKKSKIENYKVLVEKGLIEG